MKTKKYCSPGNGDMITCIPRSILESIADILNQQSECKEIKLTHRPKKLYQRIQEEIKKISKCNQETCWLEIDKLKKKLTDEEYEELQNSFRPKKPESWKHNPNEWLTTENIDHVMDQYETANPHFEYMGAIPIDFNRQSDKGVCLVSDLCKLNLKELIHQKKDSIGIVFNVDPSTKGGLHWFSIYVDLVGKNDNKPCIYYFDSVKGDIPLEIETLLQKIKDQFYEIYPDKEMNVKFNDLQHQYGDTECGVYCIHFLTEMLNGKKFKAYVDSKLTDKQMEQFRNVFFR